MTAEYQEAEERRNHSHRNRSKGGMMGSLVALGLAHSRLAITVVGRVPLLMLKSVQTVAERGFSPGEPRQELQSKDAAHEPSLEVPLDLRLNKPSYDLEQEFHLKDVARDQNRDLRPSNATVRGAASDLMNTVAKLHRDYAVVVSNFADVICSVMEKYSGDENAEVSKPDIEVSSVPQLKEESSNVRQLKEVSVRQPKKFQPTRLQPSQPILKKSERE